MNGIPLPGAIGEHARDILAGRVSPVAARDAATVVILRDGPPGLEVYMIRRKASMAFAAGAYVFPGGAVDPRDADHAVAWAGPPAAEWGATFGADESTARALVCAAVRETFEESGVLLAGPDAGSVVADTTGPGWEDDRLALIAKSLSFAEFLNRRGLVLRADLLRPWAHWITPEIESRRFDTRFFLAALPPGQRTRDVGGEADEVAWVRPAEAVERAHEGEIFLMPPTFHTLGELAEYGSVAEALATGRTIEAIMPAAVEVDGELRLLVPDMDYRMPGGRP
ncbi:8-oxo-dGTP pyrophosphatase MutT (NUDIX family) [Thermocatellispora tengchongensis]|uniref:8-oxo-dGTP pyrophosphatase MutT (NUDIX family) n=1 Tax=Thermocatellispora tengchongensis TaxID=1073253 RepID=A0A840PII8_9ACTN|nr:NUDIX domain-containing protein [Thermocatellispora tengchongensis]MBB5137621.1 8-oxo-dGTP pyrophosphatase MutT (NUDIX family) [Thermocatellispora tengchongensis]